MARCNYCFSTYKDDYSACPFCGYVTGTPATELFYMNPGNLLNSRYVVGQVIGFGGFGIIYKSWDIQENKAVAIKEYFPSGMVTRIQGSASIRLLSDNFVNDFNEGKQRFRNEQVHMAQFTDHPNILTLSDSFAENNTAYYVMEYLPGRTLSDYIEENGKVSVDEGKEIIKQVGEALKALHHAGILHRDVSPDNIVLPPEYPKGKVVLIDFGAARFSPDEKETIECRIMKPGFSPPEQYEPNAPLSEKTDIYALGATLFNILTGVKPEEATNRKVLDGLPTPYSLNNEINRNLSNAILKAMAMDIQLRIETVGQFEQAVFGHIKVKDPVKEKANNIKRKKAFYYASSLIAITGIILLGISTIQAFVKASLPEASVGLWYVVTGDETADTAKMNALTQIISDFTTAYPKVTVTLEGIDQADYENKVHDAIRHREALLLETTPLDEDTVSRMMDISSIIGNAERKNVYFLDKYTRYFPEARQMPTGFNVNLFYINPWICEYEEKGVSDLSTLMASMPLEMSERGLSYNEKDEALIASLYGNQYKLVSNGLFFSGDVGAYFSDTSEYYAVRDTMAGQYGVLYVDEDEVPAVFTDLWSVTPCEDAEKKVLLRLMQYLMNENAQDILYLRYPNASLPMNKTALQNYYEVYPDFQDFFINIDHYSF